MVQWGLSHDMSTADSTYKLHQLRVVLLQKKQRRFVKKTFKCPYVGAEAGVLIQINFVDIFYLKGMFINVAQSFWRAVSRKI